MRLLLALVAAQIAAIAVADGAGGGAPVALRVALVAAGVALAVRTRAPARAAGGAALAAATAFGHAARLEEAARAPAIAFEATVEATVAARQPLEGGVQLELETVRAVAPADAPVPPRLRLRAGRRDGEALAALGATTPGDRLRARLRIRRLEGRANPGAPDRSREAARRGVGAVASLVHPDLLVRRPDAEPRLRPLAPVHRMRARAAARLAREGEGGALVAALGVGERGLLGPPARDAFRRLGVSHLLAVSGLHLALAGALGFRLAAFALLRAGPARWRVDPRGPALAAAFVAAGGYALLAGLGVPVRRALVLLGGVALAVGARRPAPRGAPLLAAALLVLAFEPAALFDVGARLSFAASAALVWMAGRPVLAAGEGRGCRAVRALAGTASATAVAGAATAPFAAGALGVAAPGWALAANAVAIPWTGALLLPLSLAASLAAGLAPDAGVTSWLCRAAARVAALTLDVLAAAAARAPEAPPAPVPVLALAASLALAVLAARAERLPLRLLAALATIAVLRLAPPPAIAPLPPRVVALDEKRMRRGGRGYRKSQLYGADASLRAACSEHVESSHGRHDDAPPLVAGEVLPFREGRRELGSESLERAALRLLLKGPPESSDLRLDGAGSYLGLGEGPQPRLERLDDAPALARQQFDTPLGVVPIGCGLVRRLEGRPEGQGEHVRLCKVLDDGAIGRQLHSLALEPADAAAVPGGGAAPVAPSAGVGIAVGVHRQLTRAAAGDAAIEARRIAADLEAIPK
jgi:competence protein ComEC